MITIMQWNARSLKANFSELQQYVTHFHPSVIALQETWLKPHLSFNLTNYYHHRQDRTDRNGGGLAFYLHHNIRAYPIPTPPTNDELSCIQITHPIRLRILNYYHLPGPLASDTLSTINSLISGHTLIVGDFNSHHTHWGNSNSDANGCLIFDWAAENHLSFLNNSTPTHFCRGSSSVIDLSLVTPDLLPLVSWHLHPSPLGSDHFPLITSLLTLDHPPSSQTPPPSRHSYTPHWPTYTDNFMTNLPPTPGNLSVSSLATIFNNTVHCTSLRSRPASLAPRHPRHSHLPWWTPACSHAIKLRNQALWRARRTFRDIDWTDYKRRQASARRTLRQAKKDYWNRICHDLDYRSNIRTLYRIINSIRGKHHHSAIRYLIQDNRHLTSPEDITNCLANYFTSTNYSTYIPPITLPPAPLVPLHTLYLNADILPHELNCALSTARDSSPGHDGIRLSHLKHLPPDGRTHFLNILNRSWNDGELPPSWKHSIIIPILKPNKPPHLAASYRPISLTPIPCKILERILNRRLTHFLDTNNLIPPSQAGFRPHRSIFNHLTALTHDAAMAIHRHHFLVLTLLDLKQAYDSIPHNALLAKLSDIGITGRMLSWIADFLSHRTIQTHVNQSLSDTFQFYRGVPQGSVLSPTLFNVMLRDIPTPHSHNIHLALYADDIAIWTESSQPNTATNRIQNYLDRLQDWATYWGMEFSPTKSEFTIITHKTVYTIPTLTMHNLPIPYKPQVKYLGTILDHTLTWTPHLTHVKKKLTAALNALRCVTGLHWGTTRLTMIHLFRSLVRPHLDFNANILPHSPHIIHPLQIFQNRALRLCLGARKTTSIEALHLESNEMPVALRWQYISLTWIYNQSYLSLDPYFHQRWTHRDATGFYKPSSLCPLLIDQISSYLHDLALPPPRPLPHSPTPFPSDPVSQHATFILPEDSGLSKDLPIPGVEETVRRIRDQYRNHILLATDGSVQGTAAGAGIFSPHLNLHLAIRLPDSTCITNAELYALWYAYASCPNDKPKIIITDSLSALKAILHYHPNHSNHISSTIRYSLCSSPEAKHVIFLWVPSHHMITPNDKADQLAAKGCTLQHSTDPNSPPLTFQDCKRLVHRTLRQQWLRAHHFKIEQYPHLLTSSPWPSHLFSSRFTETAITRLRLGHSHLNDSLARTGVKSDNRCSTCNVPETSEHYLLECRRLQHIRRSTIQATCESKKIKCTLHNILSLGKDQHGRYDSDLINAIDRFIAQSGSKV